MSHPLTLPPFTANMPTLHAQQTLAALASPNPLLPPSSSPPLPAPSHLPLNPPPGSSREFNGWQAAPDSLVMSAIMDRAHHFMPHLSPALLQAALNGGGAAGSASVRVGLRPYAVGGLPAIGPVPGLPGVFVAAGHEGSGLSLAPGTAELVLQQLGEGPGVGAGVAYDALLPEARLRAAEEVCVMAGAR